MLGTVATTLWTEHIETSVTSEDRVRRGRWNRGCKRLIRSARHDRRLIRFVPDVLRGRFAHLACRPRSREDKNADEHPRDRGHLTETLTIFAPSRIRSTN